MNKVFIIAGPSGVGKNYFVSRALDALPNCIGIPTYTTRTRRIDDEKSKSRISVSQEEFEKMIHNNELVEYKQFNGNFYGKRKRDFEEAFDQGKNIIIEVDVQGLDDYKKAFKENLTTMFLCYESLEVMKQRILQNRPDADAEDIEKRAKIAIKEMEHKDKYDYCIVNKENKPSLAEKEILDIIIKELK